MNTEVILILQNISWQNCITLLWLLDSTADIQKLMEEFMSLQPSYSHCVTQQISLAAPQNSAQWNGLRVKFINERSNTWALDSSHPSVSWLKLTLEPEGCLERVVWGPRRVRCTSQERTGSCDTSQDSSSLTRCRTGSQACTLRRASPSWAYREDRPQTRK